MKNNRRKFTRIPFLTEGRLSLPEQELEVEVADISLKGVLAKSKTDFYAQIGSDGTFYIKLDDADAAIHMNVTLVHRESGYFGLACREIDLDSVTHLRRLVELNIGDESLLQRELSALIKQES